MNKFKILGYTIDGSLLCNFKEYFEGIGCVKSNDTPRLTASEHAYQVELAFLQKHPNSKIFIEPLIKIYGDVEPLNGRKDIVYGVRITRNFIENPKFYQSDDPLLLAIWDEFDRLLEMYSYKYGKYEILHDNNPGNGITYIRTFKDEQYLDVSLLDKDEEMIEWLGDPYSKIVRFITENGRILIGQSYQYSYLEILYIDNQAEQNANDEYNFVNYI